MSEVQRISAGHGDVGTADADVDQRAAETVLPLRSISSLTGDDLGQRALSELGEVALRIGSERLKVKFAVLMNILANFSRYRLAEHYLARDLVSDCA